FVITTLRPPSSTLFPYTTLFRSAAAGGGEDRRRRRAVGRRPPRRRDPRPTGERSWAPPRTALHRTVRVGGPRRPPVGPFRRAGRDRKSTRLNSSHVKISYAVFCL